MRALPWLMLLISVLAPMPAAAAERTLAVFDFELIDTSLDGEMRGRNADEQARLVALSEQLRRRLAESGRFRLADMAPVAEQARASNLQACGQCDAQMARKVGADLAISGTVQKVSNLILNISIYIREAATGRPLAAVNADMRGNTDESWSRSLDWLVRNRLLGPDGGALK